MNDWRGCLIHNRDFQGALSDLKVRFQKSGRELQGRLIIEESVFGWSVRRKRGREFVLNPEQLLQCVFILFDRQPSRHAKFGNHPFFGHRQSVTDPVNPFREFLGRGLAGLLGRHRTIEQLFLNHLPETKALLLELSIEKVQTHAGFWFLLAVTIRAKPIQVFLDLFLKTLVKVRQRQFLG